jgi:hypothetical protein
VSTAIVVGADGGTPKATTSNESMHCGSFEESPPGRRAIDVALEVAVGRTAVRPYTT